MSRHEMFIVGASLIRNWRRSLSDSIVRKACVINMRISSGMVSSNYVELGWHASILSCRFTNRLTVACLSLIRAPQLRHVLKSSIFNVPRCSWAGGYRDPDRIESWFLTMYKVNAYGSEVFNPKPNTSRLALSTTISRAISHVPLLYKSDAH